MSVFPEYFIEHHIWGEPGMDTLSVFPEHFIDAHDTIVGVGTPCLSFQSVVKNIWILKISYYGGTGQETGQMRNISP